MPLVRIAGSIVNARWTPNAPQAQTVTAPLVTAAASLFAPNVHTPPAAADITVSSPTGHKGRQTVSAASGTVATGTVAPNADTLLIVAAAAAQSSGYPVDTPTTALSGLGLTWTQVANQQYAFRRKLYVWWAYASSAPTPGAITIPYQASSATIQDVGWVVVEIGGADSEGPLGTVTTAEGTGATSLAVTITGTPEEGDRGFSIAALETSATVTTEQTLINQTGYTSGDNFRQLVVQWDSDATQDASQTFSWSPADSGATAAFLVNAGGVRPRTLTPGVVAAAASVYAPTVALANSPQTVTVGLLSDTAVVHSPTLSVPVSGYPDASNTGYSGALTEQYGYLETTADNQVIENKWLRGGVRVWHDNVTIRNCLITELATLGHPEEFQVAIIQKAPATGLVVEDCEIDGTGNTIANATIGHSNFDMRRCNIHNYGEGITASGNNTIEDNYLHDFTNFVPGGAHQDGIQTEYGDNVTIRHNTIVMNVDGANSCVHLSGQIHLNCLIEDNLLGAVGGKEMSMGKGVWRDNKITVLLSNYPTDFPSGDENGPVPHIFNYGLGATSCGTTYYDTNLACWNSPTAGNPVESSVSPIIYDSACS